MSIFVRARFDIHQGRQADFEATVAALRERAEEEPGTLTYRFFAAGPGSCLVLEEYTDPAAAQAHNERAADLLARVGECATLAAIELYGPIGPDLQRWVEATPGGKRVPGPRCARSRVTPSTVAP